MQMIEAVYNDRSRQLFDVKKLVEAYTGEGGKQAQQGIIEFVSKEQVLQAFARKMKSKKRTRSLSQCSARVNVTAGSSSPLQCWCLSRREGGREGVWGGSFFRARRKGRRKRRQLVVRRAAVAAMVAARGVGRMRGRGREGGGRRGKSVGTGSDSRGEKEGEGGAGEGAEGNWGGGGRAAEGEGCGGEEKEGLGCKSSDSTCR